MGEARRRGTFEERKAMAIQKQEQKTVTIQEQERKETARAKARILAKQNETPRQKAKMHRAARLMAVILGSGISGVEIDGKGPEWFKNELNPF